MHTSRLYQALVATYAGCRAFSAGSITRGVRMPTLPSTPAPSPAALDAGGSALAPLPPPAPAATPAGSSLTTQLLSDLDHSGRIHSETLRLMEGSAEWQGYESHVNFDMNVLRMRYAATPDAPLTPARRSQMQAHLRAAQAKVMEEHATAAARKFVESLTPQEVTALRDMVGRLDTPGVGAPLAAQGAGQADGYEKYRVSAENLRDALWEVSAALGKDPAAAKGGRGQR